MTSLSMRYLARLTGTASALVLLSAVDIGAQQGTRPAPRRPTATQQANNDRPENATMKCKDGTYQSSAAATACDANGGILLRYPPKATPPAAKTLDRGKARTAEDEKRLAGDTIPAAQPIRKP